jgi:hypothetical protein
MLTQFGLSKRRSNLVPKVCGGLKATRFLGIQVRAAARRSRVGILGSSLLVLVGCAQPVLRTPAQLGEADVYPVRGRQGLVILQLPIKFGPFRTDQLWRGITIGKGQLEPGELSKTTTAEQERICTFRMAGYTGRCRDYLKRTTTSEVTGIGISSKKGAHLERRDTIEEEHRYSCRLVHAEEEIELVMAGFQRDVRAGDGGQIFTLTPVHEPWTMTHPAIDGFAIMAADGRFVGMIQTSFNGVVFMSKSLSQRERERLAAVAVGVFLSD